MFLFPEMLFISLPPNPFFFFKDQAQNPLWYLLPFQSFLSSLIIFIASLLIAKQNNEFTILRKPNTNAYNIYAHTLYIHR